MFQLTKPIKVFKQEHSQLAANGANKKAKKLNLGLFALIINLANKNDYCARDYPLFGIQSWLFFLQCVLSLRDLVLLFGAQDHSFYNAHRAYKGY